MSSTAGSPTGEKRPLPAAVILAEQLLTQSLRQVAAAYGVTPSAVCVRLRRAGMPRGKEKPRHKAAAPAPIAPAVPLGDGEIERIAWVTEFGARVTLARFRKSGK